MTKAVSVYREQPFLYNFICMSKEGSPIDPTVLKETCYIAFCVVIMSMAMEAVFLIIGKWDFSVLLGNLFGAFFAVLNFFLMGLTIQSALKREQKEASSFIKLSGTYRMLMMFLVAIGGLLIPVFNPVAVILPLFFPRIGALLRPLADKGKKGGADEQ